jgi:hypothetical protein
MNARQKLIQEVRILRAMMKLELMLFGYVTAYTAQIAIEMAAGMELLLTYPKE